jgi:hypothetical protein
VITVHINKAATAESGIFLWPSNQRAVNVPQSLQSHEFFEAFEGTSEPSARAYVVGKRLIHSCLPGTFSVLQILSYKQEVAGSSPALPTI